MLRKRTPARPVPHPASITRQPCPFFLEGRRGLPAEEARKASTALFGVWHMVGWLVSHSESDDSRRAFSKSTHRRSSSGALYSSAWSEASKVAE